jgi:hypothetical protein
MSSHGAAEPALPDHGLEHGQPAGAGGDHQIIAKWLQAQANGRLLVAPVSSRQRPRPGMSAIFVAVDIGGTFTDLIGFDDEAQTFVQAKSLTTPSELTQGVINCIRESGLAAGRIDELIHGSTTAINTLIERKVRKPAWW